MPDQSGHGQHGEESGRYEQRLPAQAEGLEQVPGEAQGRRGRGGGLGAHEHPAGGESESGIEVAVPVLVGPTTDRVRGRQLGAGQPVARRQEARQRDRKQDGRACHPRRDPDADEGARADYRSEAEQDRAREAHDPLEAL